MTVVVGAVLVASPMLAFAPIALLEVPASHGRSREGAFIVFGGPAAG